MTQSQAPLNDQLRKLIQLANQNGLYDAADYIRYNVLGEKERPLADWEIELLRGYPDGVTFSST
jgi:hypothetical protein